MDKKFKTKLEKIFNPIEMSDKNLKKVANNIINSTTVKTKYHAKKRLSIAILSALFLLITPLTIYAISKTNVFSHYFQEQTSFPISESTNNQTIIYKDYEICLTSYLYDGDTKSGYCIFTVIRNDKSNDNLMQSKNSHTFGINNELNIGTLGSGTNTCTKEYKNNTLYIYYDFAVSEYGDEYPDTVCLFDSSISDMIPAGTFKLNSNCNNISVTTNECIIAISNISLKLQGINAEEIENLTIEYADGRSEKILENYKQINEHYFSGYNHNGKKGSTHKFKEVKDLNAITSIICNDKKYLVNN